METLAADLTVIRFTLHRAKPNLMLLKNQMTALYPLLLVLLGAGCERDVALDSRAAEWSEATPTMDKSSASSTRSGDGTPILKAVRTAESARADRVAFEFNGQGLPAWEVKYINPPVRDCGSGEPVAVAGKAWLQVHLVGAQAHTETGEPATEPRRRAVNHKVLRELVRTCDFEGNVTWVAGLVSRNSYTPLVLTEPSRLMINIAH
jgi:hypothetical protein